MFHTQERTIKKKKRTMKETLLIYWAGSFFGIYAGYLCGAVWMPGNDLNTFLENFRSFIIEQHHFLVGVTKATPVFIAVFWIGWSLAFLLCCTKIEHPYAGEEYGVAKWGSAKEFTRQFADHDAKNEVEVETGDVILKEPLKVNTANYWIAEGVYLSTHNVRTANLNMLVVGPPGSGKSFRLAKPLLSNLCGNYLVTDPKGELYKQTGQYFEDNGYEVMVIYVESEDSMPKSIRFNPFRYIRNESDIMSIASILMKSTTPADDAGGGNDQFFEQSAEVLLTSLIYLIHYYYPPEEQNWRTFVMLLDATTVYTKPDGAIENRPGGIMKIMERAQREWKVDHDSDFPGYVAVEKYYHGAAETTSSIVASLDAHCRYMKLNCVIDLLSEDEIRITESFGYSRRSENSRTGKRILYIVTSEDKRYYDWIVSMIYSLFFDELYHLTAIDPALNETLPQHLTFLMDEFSNVTLPDSFVEKLSTMRSRNMSAVIIVQNLIQLKRKFPKYDMDKDLIGNCSIIQILGAPDMDSCEYLSKHFGTQTIHKASDSDAKDHKGSSSRSEDVMEKSLLSAEDIFAMKKDGECAIVVKGTDPLYEKKCQMEHTPFIKLLCRKDKPYDPEKKRQEKNLRKRHSDTVILMNEQAREEAERLRGQGVPVIRMTEEDAGAFADAMRMGMKMESFVITDAILEKIQKNKKRYEKKREENKAYDFSELLRIESPDQTMEHRLYKKRVMEAQKLLNYGFTPSQLRGLTSLLMMEYTAEEIKKLFKPSDADSQIREVVDIIRE